MLIAVSSSLSDGCSCSFTLMPASGGSPQIYTMGHDGTDVTLRTADYSWNGGRSPQWIRRTTPPPGS